MKGIVTGLVNQDSIQTKSCFESVLLNVITAKENAVDAFLCSSFVLQNVFYGLLAQLLFLNNSTCLNLMTQENVQNRY